jgi:biotin synthase
MILNTKEEIEFLLSSDDEHEIKELFTTAYGIKVKNLGNKVYLRGLIELSNICSKDCFYCGIRKSNMAVDRYIMSEDEILNSSLWAFENGYGSIVLQSGERSDKNFVSFIEAILLKISSLTSDKLRITLSCGEQSKDTYQRWFDAGARRYLLRIESSNKNLYEKLHPSSHSFEDRLKCLIMLKDIGYQLGTGIMIGLPNQSLEDLANDILFFKSVEADMIGMGPFLLNTDSKLSASEIDIVKNKNELYRLSLLMIALTRIAMPTINIAAATAFQALFPFGREQALLSGANVFMPNLSEVKYRENYKLYENKPCVDENSIECLECVENRIKGIGESIEYFKWGDSLKFMNDNSIS